MSRRPGGDRGNGAAPAPKQAAPAAHAAAPKRPRADDGDAADREGPPNGGSKSIVLSGYAAGTTTKELNAAIAKFGPAVLTRRFNTEFVAEFSTPEVAASMAQRLARTAIGGNFLRAVALLPGHVGAAAAAAPRAPASAAAAAATGGGTRVEDDADDDGAEGDGAAAADPAMSGLTVNPAIADAWAMESDLPRRDGRAAAAAFLNGVKEEFEDNQREWALVALSVAVRCGPFGKSKRDPTKRRGDNVVQGDDMWAAYALTAGMTTAGIWSALRHISPNAYLFCDTLADGRTMWFGKRDQAIAYLNLAAARIRTLSGPPDKFLDLNPDGYATMYANYDTDTEVAMAGFRWFPAALAAGAEKKTPVTFAGTTIDQVVQLVDAIREDDTPAGGVRTTARLARGGGGARPEFDLSDEEAVALVRRYATLSAEAAAERDGKG